MGWKCSPMYSLIFDEESGSNMHIRCPVTAKALDHLSAIFESLPALIEPIHFLLCPLCKKKHPLCIPVSDHYELLWQAMYPIPKITNLSLFAKEQLEVAIILVLSLISPLDTLPFVKLVEFNGNLFEPLVSIINTSIRMCNNLTL